jgi:hypothetical protein
VHEHAQPRAFEQYPGAASASLPPTYRPRRPQQTALHRVVREHLLTFLAEGIQRSHDGEGYPFYVEKELRDFLSCADLSRGFARVRCARCHYETLLPFSCKNRGICPSCTGRRMADTAAYLVDMALPRARYRQWTVTFPWPIRYLMAKDYRLITAVMSIVMRALFVWQRKMARRAGHAGAENLAVAFIQRYGGAINANVHGHVVMPDAVFVAGDDEQTLEVVELAPPTDEDVRALALKIARRVSALIEKRFATTDDAADSIVDAALRAAMQTRTVSRCLREPANDEEAEATKADHDSATDSSPRRRASVDGFCIHANTQAEADDRAGLERLCRYGLRPAFSHRRLSLGDDDRVYYRLRRPWPNPEGTSVLSFEPAEFLRRLVPLIPPPFAHLVRHYGLLAPNAKHRDLLPAAPVSWTGIRPESLLAAQARQASVTAPHGASTTASSPSSPEPTALPAATTTSDGDSLPAGPSCQPTAVSCSMTVAAAIAPGRPKRQTLPWAELLRRVFSIDVLVCPQCSAPLTVIAYLTASSVLHKILNHLGLPTAPPALGPARDCREQLDLFDADDEVESFDAEPPRRSGRGPPASTGPPPTAEDWVVEFDRPQQTDNDWGA